MPLYRFYTLIAFVLAQLNVLIAQKTDVSYVKEIENEIGRVEKTLSAWSNFADSNKSIKERMEFYNVHGLSIAVIKNYKMIWAKGYGFADTSDSRPVTVETLFQAASISKSLNALGLLKLVNRKKIDLEKDINIYLRSWKFPYDTAKTHNKPITLMHLLSHSGGLNVHGFPGYTWSDQLPSDADILDGKKPAKTSAVRSEFEPGIKFKYSGGGTVITKQLITDITGESYDEYMRTEVLEPLGMARSFFTQPPPPGAFPNLATAYHLSGSPVAGKFLIYPEQAPDGLWTTPSDLAKFIIEVQLSLVGKSNKLLSRELTRTMLKPHIENAGLGVFIEGKENQKYFTHSGINEGFRCLFYGSFEGGNGVVIMVNSGNRSIILEVLDSVAKVYNWKGFKQPDTNTRIQKDVEKPANSTRE
jgi:CubicO group peptidase (beta-lactamase class C family)